ncbi:MAG: hypothetical protein ACI9VR_000704 [Cognaticolwellia sp.]
MFSVLTLLFLAADLPDTPQETLPDTPQETLPDTPQETLPDTPQETLPDTPQETLPDTPQETLPETLPLADALSQPAMQWSVPGRHAIAAHPSGLLLTASSAEPQTLRAMDPETGTLSWSLREEASAIQQIQVTPAGWLILSTNAVREIRARDGAELWRLLGGADSIGQALHTVAFCRDGVLRAYAPPSAEPLWEETCTSLSGNGSELVAATESGLTRLDPASGGLIWQIPELRGTPMALKDRILVQEGDELIALEWEQAETLWSRILIGELTQLTGGELLTWSLQSDTLSTGTLGRLDPSTGQTLWELPLPQGTTELRVMDGDDRFVLLMLQPLAYGDPPLAARVALDGSQATLIPLLTRPLTATLLTDGDLLVSSPQGVGRLDVDALGQPWDQLSAQNQLALVRAWPLGHPAELSERLIRLLQADPTAWDVLLSGLARAPERELLMLLDAIEAIAPPAAIGPLLTRAAAEPLGPLRRRISEALYAYSPEQLAPELDKSLANPSQQVLARELLLGQGTPESRARLAQALDVESSKPYAWDCKAEFFCQDGPDQDKDGWPDAFEARLGTDPTAADSDGDGLADAQDPCPMTPEHTPPDPRHDAALQTLLFGQNPGPLLIAEPVCFVGVPGPQVPKGEGLVAAGFGFPGPPGDPEEGADTMVEVNFVTGPRQATGYEVRLLWEGGRWVPERVKQAWSS